ncbi:MAG: hypothetical protein ACD_16C00130G0019 [uncultured bacterium]|nr:MAG: hypothetical protein ACD_16C00130G0019 [uncultured bacterium]OFW69591.1 MAG: hypothetical protein A2X70_01085 [Alphaproteobacteria bacterium GWC2_42_16]OFW74115.1 MAG: hypothetical protein A2Z80_04750 [Alphaproteobacteria bacterium GWA2_41_27]OFW84423.1 MAG: hypothetical protein A3E50_03435 [Alphaproteobacteria bacterium RIFCSPHIGHO2_12_FULL_42_100]OFW85944.1 MAG: hypothetical protein A2W06_05315 [Alphaproteobacteria bacterium RBG_16_42_14]OFW92270.1 MAG: hypothetical protein A3C41_030
MEGITGDNKNIPLIYNPNPRARRLSLRLSSKEFAFILTHPPRTTPRQIQSFLRQCGPWIERQVQRIHEPPSLSPGCTFSLHGEDFECVLDRLRCKPILCRNTKTLRLPQNFLQKDLYSLFKKVAHETILPILQEILDVLGQDVTQVSFRDNKTRWGSCSGRKTISLNWRLIFLPPEVARYVCAHEAAHLLHMNHSQDFWKIVSELCPTYRHHKKWLKAHGSTWIRF